jgi:hypothetical protein
VPDDLAEITLKAIAKESKNRFGSVADMREALLGQKVATKREVAEFMETIFPPDMPQLQARRALLKRGHLEYETEPPMSAEQPVTATLVWRYPVREIETGQPEPEPAAAEPDAAPTQAAQPTTAKTANPTTAAEAEETFPEMAAMPPPPRDVPARRRTPVAAYAVIAVLVAALAFVLGMVFSGQWGGKPDPAPPPPPVKVASPEPPAPETPDAGPEKPAPPAKKPAPRKAPVRRTAARPPKTDPPPATARKSTGTLLIKAPTGSKVYVADKYRGVTPLKALTLPPGEHKVIVVRQDGGSTYERTVPVRAGQQLTLTVEFY